MIEIDLVSSRRGFHLVEEILGRADAPEAEHRVTAMICRFEGGGTLMKRLRVSGLVVMLALTVPGVWADDLTRSSKFLCAAVQATECREGGECGIDLPWNLNIPDFIEVDLDAKRLSTTQASGQNRATAIAHLSRADGFIVLQGFEMGRAFSFVIAEQTGRATVAVATGGRAVAVFAACTPLTSSAGPGTK